MSDDTTNNTANQPAPWESIGSRPTRKLSESNRPELARLSRAEAWLKFATCERSELSPDARLSALAVFSKAHLYRRPGDEGAQRAVSFGPYAGDFTGLTRPRFIAGCIELQRHGWATFCATPIGSRGERTVVGLPPRLHQDWSDISGAEILVVREFFRVNFPGSARYALPGGDSRDFHLLWTRGENDAWCRLLCRDVTGQDHPERFDDMCVGIDDRLSRSSSCAGLFDRVVSADSPEQAWATLATEYDGVWCGDAAICGSPLILPDTLDFLCEPGW